VPQKKLLPIGTLVACRTDIEHLILWESYDVDDTDDVAGYVDIHEVLIVLEARKNEEPDGKKSTIKEELFSEEWKNGAYLLLSSSGIKGWIGMGWVTAIAPY
jgi:hypothetical protein